MERLAKQEIRERIWKLMEEKGIASFPRPVKGRIPNFKGSVKASNNLTQTREYKEAKVVKSNPDAPQSPFRERALSDKKILLVPTPRLKGEFFLFSEKAWGNPREASKIVNFSRYGENVRLDDIPVIDLVVVGSVAVSLRGNRVGKGEGYSELEYAILREQGKVKETTPVATTVHSIQIVPDVPSEPFDVPVDIIATESSLIKTDGLEKPKGLILEYLTREKVNDTPYLMEYLRRTNRLHIIT